MVYVHGFSADRQEVRPLPDLVAQGLGANLYFARLAGHGRTGEAMAQATPEDWMHDMAEALAIGRRIGDRVLVIGTSTGATLITVALADPAGTEGVAGVVLISPNYRLASGLSQAILDAPFVRAWGPLVAGSERSFEPLNEGHARQWTTRYPTAALFPMATLMRRARAIDLGSIAVPALFIQSPADRVVSAPETARVAAAWGGPTLLHAPDLTPQDDPHAHVVAGDILSPSQTAPLAALVVDWAQGL
ncbi:MAG TPA: alpha/beta hydrolase [Paracoccaceae bacterium]|nr:alpha/beta hydrolase [Paracoccaceae bacterium]HMO70801.1 alpha/beta hydrolase [Paracoccaceae bacterium]